MSAAGQQGRWLAIVGIGEDGAEGLSPAARALIANARLVIGGKRHLALADGLLRDLDFCATGPDEVQPSYEASLKR